uniref:GDSL esterase/lipase n=1 Tax=Salix viminalis TaxID=40686 RepID=A0A6N2M5E9_SALVM
MLAHEMKLQWMVLALFMVLSKRQHCAAGDQLDLFVFVAEILGFHNYIPPFATAREADMLYGLNYASGSAGIRDETGQELGECISLNMQLQNHHKTVQNLIGMLGNESALTYLNKCLYSVGMGNNDYLNNYFLPQFFPTSQEYTLEKYTQLLIEQYSQQLRSLYESGARKLVVFGLGKIGCVPELLNDASRLFNSKLLPAIDLLNDDLPDAKIIYINSYRIGEDSTVLDLKVNNTACCPSSAVGQCIPGQIPCQNRTHTCSETHSIRLRFLIFSTQRDLTVLATLPMLIHMIFAI